MHCSSDPCGIGTAWSIIITALKTRASKQKRTSVDGVILEETELDLKKASDERPTNRLSGIASHVRRGTAATVSELVSLRRPSQLPSEVMFDAEEEVGEGVIAKPTPALMRTDLDRARDANELDDADIESLVSTPRDGVNTGLD